ncbi:DUF4383 domain-containing protein [Streptomyces sp. WAC00263]|uniref:DUF4383 domain-containing protein n=1 Tax=Streptomyces sp. WAC00263 TaxID=1917422 RepID=UPI0015EF91EE|nr:DUF4383 domain-containing protein [Streptomyces sp. WAC00263]KAF5997494.1 DUF4383 domain-containing protein [Streptomyces sp. WAC00263]
MATHVLRPGTRRRIAFDDHLPVDHRLNTFYRIGAGLMGLFLIAFGILGLTNKVGFFTTHGDTVMGLNTNGSLSVLSICVGLLLFVGMVIGGNFASTLNMVFGVLFILDGFLNLALLDGRYNFLAFRIQNVLFSFVVGVLLMFFGMYGRVGSALPHDNPYYKARHPEEAERAEQIRALRGSASATALQQSHRAAPTPKAVGGTETKAAESTDASESTEAAESKPETKASETKAAEPPRTTDP